MDACFSDYRHIMWDYKDGQAESRRGRTKAQRLSATTLAINCCWPSSPHKAEPEDLTPRFIGDYFVSSDPRSGFADDVHVPHTVLDEFRSQYLPILLEPGVEPNQPAQRCGG